VRDADRFYAEVGLAFIALEQGRTRDMAGTLDRAARLASSRDERLYVALLLSRCCELLGDLERAQAAAEAIALSGQGGRSWSEGWALPMGVVAVAGSALIVTARPVKLDGGFDLATFSKLPLSFEGRVMPLDSLARNTLRVISGRAAYRPGQGPAVPAIAWLADVMANPEKAEQYPIFRIEDRDVQSLLGLDTQRQSLRYSYAEVLPQRPKLLQQASTADAMASRSRSPYQQHILELWGHVALYDQVASVSPLYLAPPIRPGEQWQTLGESIQGQPPNFAGIAPPAPSNPGAAAMVEMLQSYRAGDLPAFNAAANDYRADLSANLPAMQRRAEFEVLFNRLQPFLAAAAMYVLIFLVAAGSWLGWATPLRRTALLLLMLTLVLHTLALAGRIYIQGRPPVTNLYSSAIFIGWAIGVLALVLELIHRNTFGIVVASVAGFLSLLVAHNLSGDGDTMRMLQAVLDTNFWLATHVIAITIGYASTFLAGLLAITYILGGVLVRDFDEPIRKALARMVYGIVCFAMIFSFVGTILGGIWADQSWGRFWGWDPKENGAALLVLWNAIILHCRFGGIVRERGLMQLAVFGNVVTAWSWFGTNMLGVGLHAYGFMDSAVFWLGTFMMCQMLIIALGSLPLHHWRSLQAEGEQNPSRSH
jgi:ABC-type transport system involved in cytochrome c biogenesis permease subunit